MKEYKVYRPHMHLIGSKYYPLQVCDEDVLCPQCGGYGYLPDKPKCHICGGVGHVAFDDPRIVPVAGIIAP